MLETDRLLLRPYQESDWASLRELDTDPEVRRYLGGATLSEEQTRDKLHQALAEARAEPPLRHDFAVLLKGTECFIGVCFLASLRPELGQAEVGYAISRRHWGQGYGGEAVRAVLGYGFDQLKLRRIWAQCGTENIGSWRVLEKLGMRREGHLIENDWRDGQWCHTFLYALLSREWESLSAAAQTRANGDQGNMA
ncbi:MAG TPA: GNAT family N-acetyltransferase [Armatimonadota bacterium]|jgi:RimJ/RimL family protein N-acetyltransferase